MKRRVFSTIEVRVIKARVTTRFRILPLTRYGCLVTSNVVTTLLFIKNVLVTLIDKNLKTFLNLYGKI